MNPSRRVFLITAAAAVASLSANAKAQQPPTVSEHDRGAMALGYVNDASRADKNKFPNYAPGQFCNNCSLYLGKEQDATAACSLFQGKLVAGKGWCSAWIKRT